MAPDFGARLAAPVGLQAGLRNGHMQIYAQPVFEMQCRNPRQFPPIRPCPRRALGAMLGAKKSIDEFRNEIKNL